MIFLTPGEPSGAMFMPAQQNVAKKLRKSNKTWRFGSNTNIGKVQILSMQVVNVSCGTVQPGQGAQVTANIPPVEGAEAYSAVIGFTGWLNVSEVTRDGTTLNVNFLNATQEPHSGYCQFVVFAYRVL